MYPINFTNSLKNTYSAFNISPYTNPYMVSQPIPYNQNVHIGVENNLNSNAPISAINPIVPVTPVQVDSFSYSNQVDTESGLTTDDAAKTAGLAAVLHLITLGIQKVSCVYLRELFLSILALVSSNI